MVLLITHWQNVQVCWVHLSLSYFKVIFSFFLIWNILKFFLLPSFNSFSLAICFYFSIPSVFPLLLLWRIFSLLAFSFFIFYYALLVSVQFLNYSPSLFVLSLPFFQFIAILVFLFSVHLFSWRLAVLHYSPLFAI